MTSEPAVLAVDDERWRDFVLAHPRAWAHHRPEWSEVLRRTTGTPGLALCLVDAAGAVTCGVPLHDVPDVRGRRHWLVAPGSPCPAPLGEPADARRLAREAHELQRRAHVHAVRVGDRHLEADAEEPWGRPPDPVPVAPGGDALERVASAWTLGQLARARRDLRAEPADLLALRGRLRPAAPVRTLRPGVAGRYRRALRDLLDTAEAGFAVAVRHGDEPLGVAVCLAGRSGLVLQHCLVAASPRAPLAAVALLDAVLTGAARRGCAALHLGDAAAGPVPSLVLRDGPWQPGPSQPGSGPAGADVGTRVP